MELNEPKNEDVVKFLDTLTAEEQLRGETTEENFDEEMMDYELETFWAQEYVEPFDRYDDLQTKDQEKPPLDEIIDKSDSEWYYDLDYQK